MLKFVSQNEKNRRRLTKKEIHQKLYHFFRPFFGRTANIYIRRYLSHQESRSFLVTKVRNICILTGRNRSVYRTFRLSRLKLREYAASGYFVGLAKAS